MSARDPIVCPSEATPLLEVAPHLVTGVRAWTTGRETGSFGLGDDDSVIDVMHRWDLLLDQLSSRGIDRLASAHQVHGARVATHERDWQGWLRMRGIDGHFTRVRGTALAVTVADCTPVFIAHPRGAVAALHAGWRGVATQILEAGLSVFAANGFAIDECIVHLGPAICGRCYEVGPEVRSAVFGQPASGKALLDVRAVLSERAAALGVRDISLSASCTRCDNHRFFSHRAGDSGRQLGIIELT